MRYSADTDYEQYVQNFIAKFSQEEEYVAYGAGNVFVALREIFGEKLKIKYCIDMNPQKKLDGLEIYLPDKLKDCNPKPKIIITTNGGYSEEIANRLEMMGYGRDDYCYALELISIWGWHFLHKTYALFCAVILGFACNLQCKGCSEYVTYHKSKQILSYEIVKDTVDRYFDLVDYVVQIEVYGGEAFICQDIGKICEYIEKEYKDHFHKMVIHTNGIIVPKDEVLGQLSKCRKLHIWISDYSNSINQQQRKNVEIFRRRLKEYGIKHNDYVTYNQMERVDKWFDLGNPLIKKNETAKALQQKFSLCSGVCFSIYRCRLYYCLMELSAVETGIFNGVRKQDYIDMLTISHIPKEKQAEAFLKFQLGFLNDGYLSFCDNCNGLGADVNNKYIEAGIQ